MDAAGSYSTGAAVQSPQSVTETLLDLLRDDVASDVPLEIPALEDGHMISEVFPNNLLK
jgi:hypothetical protein